MYPMGRGPPLGESQSVGGWNRIRSFFGPVKVSPGCAVNYVCQAVSDHAQSYRFLLGSFVWIDEDLIGWCFDAGGVAVVGLGCG